MKFSLFAFAVFAISAAKLAAADAPLAADWAQSVKFPQDEKRVVLFDGKDLTGWKGNDVYCSVENGAIVGRNTSDNPPKVSTLITVVEADAVKLR